MQTLPNVLLFRHFILSSQHALIEAIKSKFVVSVSSSPSDLLQEIFLWRKSASVLVKS